MLGCYSYWNAPPTMPRCGLPLACGLVFLSLQAPLASQPTPSDCNKPPFQFLPAQVLALSPLHLYALLCFISSTSTPCPHYSKECHWWAQRTQSHFPGNLICCLPVTLSLWIINSLHDASLDCVPFRCLAVMSIVTKTSV